MEKKHANKLYTWKAVSDVLSANRAIWEGQPAFRQAAATFEVCRTKVSTLGSLQLQESKSITRRKNSFRARAVEAACQAALNLKAWAEDQDNDALAAVMQVNRSGLLSEGDPLLADLLGDILERSAANQAVLADYGTDEALLTALRESLEGFRRLIAAPKTFHANRAAATGNLHAAFHEGRKALDRLNDLVGNFSRTQPDFAVVFRKACKATHNGVRHLPDTKDGQAA